MKTKIVRSLLILLIIMAMLIPMITYGNNTGGAFFIVDKNEIAPGKTVTMTVNLDKINYEEFEFTLSSNVSLSDVTSDSSVDTSLNGNNLRISATKSEILMQQIELYYKVPESVPVGSTIILTAKIEPVESTTITTKSEEVLTLEETEVVTAPEANSEGDLPENVESENSENIPELEQDNHLPTQETTVQNEAQEVTVTIKVVETSDDDEEKEGKMMSDKENMDKEKSMDKEKMSKDMEKDDMDKEEMSEKSTSMKSTSSASSTSTAETVVYNGESNNYLSSLSVEGYNFTQTFSKTNQTYFLTVPSDVTNLNVNATAEDSNAIVSVYGNTTLIEGKNKILISVTAENGEVKTYRIYVTK